MTVGEYVAILKSPSRQITEELRRIAREAAPEAAENFKWRTPVYKQDGLLCYIASVKEHVRFGSTRTLPSPLDGILENGNDHGGHIRLHALEEASSLVWRKPRWHSILVVLTSHGTVILPLSATYSCPSD